MTGRVNSSPASARLLKRLVSISGSESVAANPALEESRVGGDGQANQNRGRDPGARGSLQRPPGG